MRDYEKPERGERGGPERPMSRLEQRVEEERKMSAEFRSSRDVDPPNEPQVMRELNLVTGILDSLESAVARLIVKIEPVCSVAPKMMDDRTSINEDWDVSAPVAVQLRSLYEQIARMELQINIATGRVQL